MPILIRPAEQRDMEAVAAIYRPAVLYGLASFELEPPDAAEMERRWRGMADGGYPYLVAEQDGAILGYAYAGPYRARPAYRNAIENAVYVSPDAQRVGVGRALLAALIKEAEKRNFRQMIAVIGDSANQASIGLHRSQGFVFSGVLHSVGFKQGRWLDSVLMQRPLGAGDTAEPTLPEKPDPTA